MGRIFCWDLETYPFCFISPLCLNYKPGLSKSRATLVLSWLFQCKTPPYFCIYENQESEIYVWQLILILLSGPKKFFFANQQHLDLWLFEGHLSGNLNYQTKNASYDDSSRRSFFWYWWENRFWIKFSVMNWTYLILRSAILLKHEATYQGRRLIWYDFLKNSSQIEVFRHLNW